LGEVLTQHDQFLRKTHTAFTQNKTSVRHLVDTNLYRFELHRPSSIKGTKLLFHVIKAIIIIHTLRLDTVIISVHFTNVTSKIHRNNAN